MNEFKTPRRRPGGQRQTTDGFVTRDRGKTTRPQLDNKINLKPTNSPRTYVDDFSAVDGFHPSRNQMLNAAQDQPFDQHLDGSNFLQEEQQEKSTKKRVFRRKKNKQKQKLSWPQKLVRVFGFACIAAIIFIIGLVGWGIFNGSKIFRGNGNGAAALDKNVDPVKLKGEGDGRVNILILGKGGPGHEAPDLTDTLLLVSIDPVQNEAAMVSVPRDMYVQNADGASMKINAVYSTAKQKQLSKNSGDKNAAEDAGLSAIRGSVTEVLGIPVHYHVMVDFEAFKKAIDTVGGIDINVKEPLRDTFVAWELGGNPLIADKGWQHFDGKRALFYARSRHGSARGDFDRTERQRQVIVALKDKVLSAGTYSDPVKVISLAGNFGDRVRSDIDLRTELPRLYEIAKNISSDKIASVGLADPPNVLVQTGNINGQSIVQPTEGLYKYENIHSFIRNNIKDAFLKSEDAKLIVLNGTATTGAAAKKSQELKSYGYNVISVGDAPTKNYPKMVLVDMTNGAKKYTKSYLEKRLGITSVTALPDPAIKAAGADFVIILGQQ